MPARTNLYFNGSGQYGGRLRSGLNALETAMDHLNDVLANMTTMIDGDGSADAHYAEIQDRYGFKSDSVGLAEARLAYAELSSVMAKLNNDTEQTNVNSAINQVINRLR